MNQLRQKLLSPLYSSFSTIIALLIGLALGLVVTSIAGESPITVMKAIANGAFGSAYDISMTLFYTGPLIFTGLAVAIAFHAGLFNIGAEGQLQIGAFAMAWFALQFPHLPVWVAIPSGVLFGALCGGIWGGIAGVIRAYRQGHEVIVTIMLNFIATALTAYLTLEFFRTAENQNTETAMISDSYRLSEIVWSQGAPLSSAFFIALLIAVIMHFFLYSTRWGYQLRAVGGNSTATEQMGFSIQKLQVISLVIAGGLAAGVGIIEIYGNAHRFRMGFSADFGFMGIPVALLARSRPLAIPFSALLFAALHTGSTHLDLETERLTKEVSQIFQALVILAVSAEGFFRIRQRSRRGSRQGSPKEIQTGNPRGNPK